MGGGSCLSGVVRCGGGLGEALGAGGVTSWAAVMEGSAAEVGLCVSCAGGKALGGGVKPRNPLRGEWEGGGGALPYGGGVGASLRAGHGVTAVSEGPPFGQRSPTAEGGVRM